MKWTIYYFMYSQYKGDPNIKKLFPGSLSRASSVLDADGGTYLHVAVVDEV